MRAGRGVRLATTNCPDCLCPPLCFYVEGEGAIVGCCGSAVWGETLEAARCVWDTFAYLCEKDRQRQRIWASAMN